MTTTQTHVTVRDALLGDKDFFDMWHDYMNLGGLVQQQSGGRETHTGPDEWLENDPRSRSPLSPSEDSRGSGSISSLSDISSGTSVDYCRFCKSNGESWEVYRTHKLKSLEGKVLCPILWKYTCPVCEATGDYAHTLRYCPQTRRQEQRMLQPERRRW